MAHWIGAQGGQSWSKILNMLSLWRHQEKTPTRIIYFFLIETKNLNESLDGLNSSVVIVADEL